MRTYPPGLPLLILAALASLTLDQALAMDFTPRQISPGLVGIAGIGEIMPGDSDRLMSVLVTLPRDDKKVLMLSSPGGSIVAAESLAATVRQARMGAVVFGDEVCASACFIVYAASPVKFFGSGARIGIHSATDRTGETPASMAMTTVMARTASEMGVPDAIVGRMIRTAPGDMAWLSEGELVSMGASKIEPPASGTSPATPATPTTAPSTVVAGLPQAPPLPSTSSTTQGRIPADPSTPSYQQGLSDRTSWEHWFEGLAGDFQQGANYWTAERSKKRPGGCNSGSTDFRLGCSQARQMLTPTDYRRRTDPQYWWGWNSFEAPDSTSTPTPVSAPAPIQLQQLSR